MLRDLANITLAQAIHDDIVASILLDADHSLTISSGPANSTAPSPSVLLRQKRQAPYPKAVVREDDDRTDFQILVDGDEIVEKQSGLRRRTSVRLAAEQHHGWFLEMAVCQKRCEIGVGRDDDPALSSSSLQNDSVACRGEPEVPNVHGVMTRRIEELGELRGEVLVDEESHAGRRRGSSCSRTASAA